MIMDYQTIINDILSTYVHPCDAEIPAGHYRRILWQGHTENFPSVGVEWDTVIIPIGTKLYNAEPFGHRSIDLPVINPPAPPVEGETPPPAGILVPKIGYYFTTQAEIDAYITSIGAVKINGGNDWYGADLSKSSLYKNSGELVMYMVENSGGYMAATGPTCDQRIRQSYNPDTGAFTNIDYYWSGDRIAYMKHDETGEGHCKYTGMRVNTNADTSIPPIPPAIPSAYGSLPSEIARMTAMTTFASFGCVPATVGFAYSNISDAMLKAWNETRNTFKIYFDKLTGLCSGSGGISTVYDGLSIAMEEIAAGALALSQQAWQAAIKVFKEVLSSALNIIGGAWDMIKSFLPKITILGVTIDIYELIFGDNSVQQLKDAFSEIIKNGKATYEEVINGIYSAIGSAYDYSVEYVKAGARDLVDACTTLFDWCITMFQNGCVALVDLYGRIMQLWSMPPIVPNPLWAAVLAIRNILMQIKPLDIILSGNFPSFTAMDLYNQAQAFVKAKIDAVYQEIHSYYEQARALYRQLTAETSERDSLKTKFEQYKKYMWEQVTEATTKAYEAAIDAANAAIEKTKALYESMKAQISDLKALLSDTYSMAIEELKKLPIMAQINEFLGMCGIAFDELLETYHNAVAGAKSLYKNFVDSSRSFKDTCKVIYNQICTLALSKITQYVNKLLSLIGLNIQFPTISFCIPMLQY